MILQYRRGQVKRFLFFERDVLQWRALMASNTRQPYCDTSMFDVMFEETETLDLTSTVHFKWNKTTKFYNLYEQAVSTWQSAPNTACCASLTQMRSEPFFLANHRVRKQKTIRKQSEYSHNTPTHINRKKINFRFRLVGRKRLAFRFSRLLNIRVIFLPRALIHVDQINKVLIFPSLWDSVCK